MESLERYIKEHEFFQGLSSENIDFLVGCASNVHFKDGEFMCREGKDANQFFLIREGIVAVDIHVPQKGAVTIDTLQTGQILGWSWLFPPYRWYFDARVRIPVRAIALDAQCVRNKIIENHELGFEILKRFSKVLVGRLDATRLQLMDVYSASA